MQAVQNFSSIHALNLMRRLAALGPQGHEDALYLVRQVAGTYGLEAVIEGLVTAPRWTQSEIDDDKHALPMLAGVAIEIGLDINAPMPGQSRTLRAELLDAAETMSGYGNAPAKFLAVFAAEAAGCFTQNGRGRATAQGKLA